MKTNSKRILIFSLAYEPYIGGAELAVKEITARISGNYIFDMITLRYDSSLPKFEKIGNVNVYRVGPSKKTPSYSDMLHFPMYMLKVLYPLLAFLKAFRLQFKYHYDAVWSIMTYMGFPALFFKLFFWKTKIILTLQDGDTTAHLVGRKRIRIVYPLLKLAFYFVDFVQPISTHLQKYAEQLGYRGKLLIVPNGVSDVFFDIIPPEKIKEERRVLGYSDDDIIIITTSRLVAKNAVGDIISALSFLPLRYKLLVVGDGPLMLSLEDQVSNLGLEERVTFLGEANHRDIPKYLQMANIFVRPSLSEGLGSSFLEAMASGLPIVGTPVGGIIDFLKDIDEYNEFANGAYAQISDPQSIANAVFQITEDEALYQSIRKNGKTMIYEDYRWEGISERIEKEIFDVVINK